MFERYTEKARRVVFFARYEASQFGSPYIEPEHLLLGLLREDKALPTRLFRSFGSVGKIRQQIEAHTFIREKVSTSVDLPLSNECKRVLAYAAEEAERLSHRHIGSEHLLLGLLRETNSFAAQLLNSEGVFLDRAREFVSHWQLAVKQTADSFDIVGIHGAGWDVGYVRSTVAELQKFAWRKREWKPIDVLKEINMGRIFFDLSMREDPGFEFVPGGWPRELCALCHWELKADAGPEHADGYTNGREWVCSECYEKFLGSSGNK